MFISYNEACGLGCSTLEKDLELCEKMGFDYIEIRLDLLFGYLKTHTVEELAEYFRTHQIKPHAFNALYLYPEFLREEDDPRKQTFLLGQFLYACEIGRKIGNHYMIVVPPFLDQPNHTPFPGSEEEKNSNCIRMLRELGLIAKKYDMRLCFELVGFPRSSVRTIENARKIVSAVDMDHVGYALDAYNIYLSGGDNDFEPIKALEKEKIFAVHLNSADDVPEWDRSQERRCFLGKGVIDINKFLCILKEVGYEGMCSIETFRPQYWTQTPEWVIENAYSTTYEAMRRSRCI